MSEENKKWRNDPNKIKKLRIFVETVIVFEYLLKISFLCKNVKGCVIQKALQTNVYTILLLLFLLLLIVIITITLISIETYGREEKDSATPINFLETFERINVSHECSHISSIKCANTEMFL